MLAIVVLEGGGSLEYCQLLLEHKLRNTTEKYYVALTKKRMEKAIDARRPRVKRRTMFEGLTDVS